AVLGNESRHVVQVSYVHGLRLAKWSGNWEAERWGYRRGIALRCLRSTTGKAQRAVPAKHGNGIRCATAFALLSHVRPCGGRLPIDMPGQVPKPFQRHQFRMPVGEAN